MYKCVLTSRHNTSIEERVLTDFGRKHHWSATTYTAGETGTAIKPARTRMGENKVASGRERERAPREERVSEAKRGERRKYRRENSLKVTSSQDKEKKTTSNCRVERHWWFGWCEWWSGDVCCKCCSRGSDGGQRTTIFLLVLLFKSSGF